MRLDRRLRIYFLFGLVVLILQPFLQKLEWMSELVGLKNADEFLLILFMPLAIRGFSETKQFSIRRFRGLFLLYVSLGIAFAFWNRVPMIAMTVQAIFELKFFFVLFIMISMGRVYKLQVTYESVLKLIIVLNLPFVFFQFLNPTQYDDVFKSGGHAGLFILKDSTLTRAAGIFWHQNQLAFFSAISAAYFLIIRKFSWTNPWVVLSLSLLVSTLQRQEIVSFILAYLFAQYLFVKESFKGKRALYFFGSLSLLTLLAIVFWPLIELFIQQSGLLELSQSIDPRIVFYYNSFLVFFDYFPFGSGFGTFGGYAAANYNQSLYNELNFGNYTWYNQNVFLTDTYYPHVIAETGVFGVICFVLFSAQLFRFIRSSHAAVKFKILAVFSLTLLISVSFTSPNFNDIFCLFLTFASFSLMMNSHKEGLDVKAKSLSRNTPID